MINTHVLKRPIITEKSMNETAKNKYTFEVDKKATKGQIRSAVEETFGVEVVAIATTKTPGKKRRVGRMRREVEKPGAKKAFIEIKGGQKIEIFETQT